MKTALTVFVLLATMINCDGRADDREPSPLDLDCQTVVVEGGSMGMERCENVETICYVANHESITCMRKDAP